MANLLLCICASVLVRYLFVFVWLCTTRLSKLLDVWADVSVCVCVCECVCVCVFLSSKWVRVSLCCAVQLASPIHECVCVSCISVCVKLMCRADSRKYGQSFIQ